MHPARSVQHSRSAEPVKAPSLRSALPATLTEPASLPLGFPPGRIHCSSRPGLRCAERPRLTLGSVLRQGHRRLLQDHDPFCMPTDRTDQLRRFLVFLRSDLPVPASPGLHQACALQYLVILRCMPRDRRGFLEILECQERNQERNVLKPIDGIDFPNIHNAAIAWYLYTRHAGPFSLTWYT